MPAAAAEAVGDIGPSFYRRDARLSAYLVLCYYVIAWLMFVSPVHQALAYAGAFFYWCLSAI
jgi:hypothetical protein